MSAESEVMKDVLLCLGGTAVAAGLPLYILRKIRQSALSSESPELLEPSKPIKRTVVRNTRPIDDLSPRRPEPKPLAQHPEIETFVGAGQKSYENLELLHKVSGSKSEIIDGTCRDTDS